MSKREDAITVQLQQLQKDDHIQDLYIWETPAGAPRWTFHTTNLDRKRTALTMTQAEYYLLGFYDGHGLST